MVEINKALAPIWCSMMRVKLHMHGRGLSVKVGSLVVMQDFGFSRIKERCFKNRLHFFMTHPFQRPQPASIKIMVYTKILASAQFRFMSVTASKHQELCYWGWNWWALGLREDLFPTLSAHLSWVFNWYANSEKRKTLLLLICLMYCFPPQHVDQIFGSHLHLVCEHENSTVPQFVRQCIKAVEKRGEYLNI